MAGIKPRRCRVERDPARVIASKDRMVRSNRDLNVEHIIDPQIRDQLAGGQASVEGKLLQPGFAP